MSRIVSVAFADEQLKNAFEKLGSGTTEDVQLADSIKVVIAKLNEDPSCGIRIPPRLWPKEYIRKYKIRNLWKYNLPGAWRIIYTLRENELEIISVIIEWFNHKGYERRFGYK